ncbi:hypothetical protein LguiB_036413 [Lonicera macranthoides]
MPVLTNVVKRDTSKNIRDTVRMVCLHLYMTLLFANTGNSIGWFIVNWVGNLLTMANYNWARAIHEFLMNTLIKKEKRPSSVTGCTILLLLNNVVTDDVDDADDTYNISEDPIEDSEMEGETDINITTKPKNTKLEIGTPKQSPTKKSSRIRPPVNKCKAKGKSVAIEGKVVQPKSSLQAENASKQRIWWL